MPTPLRRLAILVLIAGVLTISRPAKAQEPPVSPSAAVAVLVLVVGGGFLLYHYVLRTPPTIKGCITSGGAGLTLQDESPDNMVYTLTGDTAALKTGRRMKLKGKRQKPAANFQHDFVVEEIKKDYGPCRIHP